MLKIALSGFSGLLADGSVECFLLCFVGLHVMSSRLRQTLTKTRLKGDSLRGNGEKQHVLYVASVSWRANTSSADTTPSTKWSDGDSLFSLSGVHIRQTTTRASHSTRQKKWHRVLFLYKHAHLNPLTLPLPFPEEWISRRVQKGSWSEVPGPSSSHLLPSHIVC